MTLRSTDGPRAAQDWLCWVGGWFGAGGVESLNSEGITEFMGTRVLGCRTPGHLGFLLVVLFGSLEMGLRLPGVMTFCKIADQIGRLARLKSHLPTKSRMMLQKPTLPVVMQKEHTY